MLDAKGENGANKAAVLRPLATAARPLTVATVGLAWRALVDAIGDELKRRERLWALEASPGRRPLFVLPDDAFVVGVGPDRASLEGNPRLDERVVSDLSDFRPWAAGFDLVTCWYALEHGQNPERALDRLAAWTAPDGLIVLAGAHRSSLRAAWARLRKRARSDRTLSPAALRSRFAAAGFSSVLEVFYEDARQLETRRRVGLTHSAWKVARAVVWILTLGRLDAARTDYILVVRRDRAILPVLA